jgi:hypothetical protein
MRTQSKVNKGVVNKNDCLTTSERAKQYAKGPADALRAVAEFLMSVVNPWQQVCERRLQSRHKVRCRTRFVRPILQTQKQQEIACFICTTIPTKRNRTHPNSGDGEGDDAFERPTSKNAKTYGKVSSPGERARFRASVEKTNSAKLLSFT